MKINLKSFLRSRAFLINTAIMIVLTVVLLWLGFKFLDVYSRHGQKQIVPDFVGQMPEDLEENSDYDVFKFIVNDSIYDNSRPGGSISDQDPPPGMEVKKKRTILLTVIMKDPEYIRLPELGNTLRQAKSQLEAYGLKLGKVNEVPSKYPNLLLKVYHKGKEIEAGDKIMKGARIDLDVGSGEDQTDSLMMENDVVELTDDFGGL